MTVVVCINKKIHFQPSDLQRCLGYYISGATSVTITTDISINANVFTIPTIRTTNY